MYHYIDIMSYGIVLVKKIGIFENFTDILTQVFYVIKFKHCLDLICVIIKRCLVKAIKEEFKFCKQAQFNPR